MTGNKYGVLVGYDGSLGSRGALSWATQAARERGTVLTICHAWTAGDAGPAFEPEHEDPAEASARWILSTAVPSPGSAEIQQILVKGPAARVLCELSSDADVVVAGSRGLDGLSGLILGPVSFQVAALTVSPVVVVHERWRPTGGYLPGHIVAGVDGSAASKEVLDFAGTEAILRRVPLMAVCALADAPGELGAGHDIGENFERMVTDWEKDHPGVELHRQVTDKSARAALLDAAQDAQLLVLGRRGRGGLPHMVLGTVTETLLSHTPCPVAVVGAR